MIAERIDLPFFVQCDTQIAKQEELVDLLAGRDASRCLSEWNPLAGKHCWRRTSRITTHNFTETSSGMCRKRGIITHFSNIIGFPGRHRSWIQEHLDALIEVLPGCRIVLHPDADSRNAAVRRIPCRPGE